MRLRSALRYFAAGLILTALAASLNERRRKFSFRGKVAVITGSSRGLGFLIARELLQRGCRVVISARSDDELLRAEKKLKHFGTQIISVECDLTREEGCRKLIGAAQSYYGTIDILVNNAGIIISGPQASMTVPDYEELMKVHFWAPFHLTQAVLPEMLSKGSGRICNIASIGAKVPVPHLLPYTASKFALRGFSEGLRSELARSGIYVTTICPGLMRTGSQINAFFKGNYSAEYSWFKTVSAIPGISINAVRAAERVVRAIEFGEAEVVVGLSAKIADKVYGLVPNLVGEAMNLVARALPDKETKERLKGREIQPPLPISIVTSGLDADAARFNEV